MAISRENESPRHEVIIIGAGVCGIYQLYRLLELGIDVTVLEAGGGPGGTWYWNRYPGCRFDSESYTYGYSFSKELLEEWDWSEHFAGQPETLRYLNHVVEKFDLRRHMQFNCKVDSAVFDDDASYWTLQLADGRTLTTRFLLTAIGMLSAPTMPLIEGVASFEGEAYHTYYWPQEPVDTAASSRPRRPRTSGPSMSRKPTGIPSCPRPSPGSPATIPTSPATTSCAT
ncbi:MAG: NAD(P)-binding domain-containing protein [Alphaproteobacteria bacterium]|jgi:cation diffusion facilitator CzcD-associated flavoprotein CzcO|nr:NAD(P)-binding domain-containing protein [Alphaproteobacteria bacterium]MDP6813181.1 NAD(P)-binding domain-containing protein [Alphaproteobacteria bacterium]